MGMAPQGILGVAHIILHLEQQEGCRLDLLSCIQPAIGCEQGRGNG